jgi:hypothetical protein
MSVDPDKDMLALPGGAGDGVYFRIGENES